MKFLILLIILIVIYLLSRKVVVIDPKPLKADFIRLKKAVAWLATKFKLLKSKFTKKS